MQYLYFFASAFVFLFPNPAYAYIDPGMGSLILQSLFGAVVGGLVFLKLYWRRAKEFFSGFKKKMAPRQKDQ